MERVKARWHTDGDDLVQVSSTQLYSADARSLDVVAVAIIKMDSLPQRDGSLLVVPPAARAKAELMLEQCANSLCVLMVTPRAIFSPEPYLAFEWETEDEKEYLLDAEGFAVQQGMKIKSELAVAMTLDSIELLADRPDGAALLAEGLSQSHALGKFREYMRLFELAFALPVSQMAKKVAQFLRSGEGGYTMTEVRRWIDVRNPATHAQDGAFVTEAAARHFIARLEQAAYDVLYNKDLWRDRSSTRRDVFRPTTWSTFEGGTIAVEQGSVAHLRHELLDGFLAYPLDRSFQIQLTETCWSNPVVRNRIE